ncbi:LLM class flavin-dependent oxidoreductase [Streptomyces albiaxialis]|uniref:LLM class flavin-dependent oxidoreductase n=1 Tax=Streptomyces albiaxialis TaxID=329523 RepID=A0ABP5GZC9_9ACTN
MRYGLGLPVNDLSLLAEWARRAEASPFRTVALLDRLVYGNPDPLITLATVAGATSRVRVQTEVLLAPHYNTAVLAKQTATLDRLSGGRFTLGIGIGGREDDAAAAGIDPRRRGRRLDAQMALLRRTWAGEPYGDGAGPVGPAPATPGGPEVLFGGFAPAALERVGRWGDGFLGAGLPAPYMDRKFREVERGWQRHGREGRPRLVAQVNAALGSEALVEEARKEIGAYYAFTGHAEYMVEGLLSTPESIREAVTAYGDIGADELVFYCWAADPAQADRLAALVP